MSRGVISPSFPPSLPSPFGLFGARSSDFCSFIALLVAFAVSRRVRHGHFSLSLFHINPSTTVTVGGHLEIKTRIIIRVVETDILI